MTKDEFENKILEYIPQIVDLDWEFLVIGHSTVLRNCVERLYEDGFTVRDAAKFMKCFEDISPDLDEDIALKKMNALKAKYYQPEVRRKILEARTPID